LPLLVTISYQYPEFVCVVLKHKPVRGQLGQSRGGKPREWGDSGLIGIAMLIVLVYSELAREKMWSRIHLIPLLTAEEDRDLVRRHYADQAREKALLGSQTSPYNSDRYVFFSLVPEGELRSGLVDWRRWGWRWSWNTTGQDESVEEQWLIFCVFYRFVRPTFAVTPSERSK